ncbi:bicaudal D-related protein homolog isoform X2 [Pomacea canaliculata]|uniref:bicaudal D-related protein homolog isoform X1 n=1 Tax=Pomacea canaliculata TaxID=400727 RepID=UPI000D72FB7C|nr:bicaudal D-related protein homolog isoform X1 [Pomacea canaliculata]XP_025090986.1 bicaudal D-related protein homolog isoform X2 [Pomacea canaliculata]
MSEEEENCEYQQTTDGSSRSLILDHRHDLDTRPDVRILGENLDDGDQSVDRDDDDVTYDDNYADVSDEEQEDDGDVYAQLARKERDLLLAAQLGKALLEENEELRRQNMALSQECSQRMEEWQQQKHELQMQLAQRQSEYESTIRDLNDDLTILQERLDNRHHQEWAGNHQHASTMRRLQQHCEYLSEQLQQSLTSQQTLESEVRRLKETAESQNAQLCHRDSCIGQLEGEVSMLQYKNNEAEVEMKAGKDQRTSLIAELEEAHERILLLEKQRRELETQLHQVMNELRELQETNNMLQAELDRLNSRHHNDSGSSQTLFSELYQSSHSSLLGPEQFGQENNLDRIASLSAEMLDEDNFEYDEDFITGMNPNYSSPIYGHEHFGGSVYMSEGEVNISSLSLDPDNNKDNNRDGEQVDDERKENSDEEKCQKMLPHSEVFEESTTSGVHPVFTQNLSSV